MAAPVRVGVGAAAAGLVATSHASTAIGDLVVVVTGSSTTVSGIPTHTLQSASNFVEIGSGTVDDGVNDGRLSIAYKIAAATGAQSYQAYTSSTGTSQCVAITYQAGTFSVASLPPSAFNFLTTNGAPNPPALSSLTGDYAVLAIGMWCYASNTANTGTAPANYSVISDAGLTQINDIVVCARDMTGLSGASEDPAAITDNTAPACSIGCTVAIRAPASVSSGQIVLDGGGTLSIAASTRTVPAGVLVLTGAGDLTIADSTVSGGGPTEHFSGSLVLDGAGALVVAASTRQTFSAIAADGGGTLAVAASTRTTFSSVAADGAGTIAIAQSTRSTTGGPLALDGAGTITIVNSTVSGGFTEHFSGALDLTGAGTLAVASSTREAMSGAVALDGGGSLAVVATVRETFSSVAASGAGLLDIADSSVFHPPQEIFSGQLALDGSGLLSIADSDVLHPTGLPRRNRVAFAGLRRTRMGRSRLARIRRVR